MGAAFPWIRLAVSTAEGWVSEAAGRKGDVSAAEATVSRDSDGRTASSAFSETGSSAGTSTSMEPAGDFRTVFGTVPCAIRRDTSGTAATLESVPAETGSATTSTIGPSGCDPVSIPPSVSGNRKNSTEARPAATAAVRPQIQGAIRREDEVPTPSRRARNAAKLPSGSVLSYPSSRSLTISSHFFIVPCLSNSTGSLLSVVFGLSPAPRPILFR